jgi:hypothetical protein
MWKVPEGSRAVVTRGVGSKDEDVPRPHLEAVRADERFGTGAREQEVALAEVEAVGPAHGEIAGHEVDRVEPPVLDREDLEVERGIGARLGRRADREAGVPDADRRAVQPAVESRVAAADRVPVGAEPDRGLAREQALPAKRVTCQRRGLQSAVPVLQHPVAALPRRTGGVDARRHVRTGEQTERAHEVATGFTAGEITSVEEQVGVRGESVTPARDDLGVPIQALAGEPGAPELNGPGCSVGENVDGADAVARREGVANLRDSVCVRVEEHDFQAAVLRGGFEVGHQRVPVLQARVDEGDLQAHHLGGSGFAVEVKLELVNRVGVVARLECGVERQGLELGGEQDPAVEFLGEGASHEGGGGFGGHWGGLTAYV